MRDIEGWSRVDAHVHTCLSPDSEVGLVDHCARAALIGLDLLVVTDHIDVDPRDPAYEFAPYAERFEQVERARARWGSQVGLAIGVEVSYETRLEAQIRDYLETHVYDFVLGAIHDGFSTPFRPDRLRSAVMDSGPVGILKDVADESISAVRSGLFDAIAHLDRVKSWVSAAETKLAPHELVEAFAPCLEAMADSGVALEINTSGDTHGVDETFPGPGLVDAFAAVGGTHITIGSDAHDVCDLGYESGALSKMQLDSFQPAETIRALLARERPTALRSSLYRGRGSRVRHRTN